ncbi:N-acetylmuramoyl-L-alanine amidase [Sphaerobacter thermophilus]|jgi:hypothetical protein|uniref:N-acetylmuramoyl-L-alanine amidase family 2 n=1 Tax=Sphaerobacter thermophilus (strain ATCC 49802 / DSM 20745 / KCCM 41009 / NCIMB 13125 / S 6022) TaxID=479434 RepID=D1C5E0_SPHTD|nr:peptidoglycan recognition family protein [Sphaerobacter thermophilus]ACZ37456.1 N-acetylmuramoyl-L-alanine amidase family 2 [Sphaerobacter thermophilus DSM 20745]PZN64555.1 MAG: N-acetylmuramoyl-L-alanine amidase [Sphaerobacter thermophilus]
MTAGGLQRLPLIDLRARLATNPHGGPATTVPLARKRGIVIHYHGPAIPPDADEVAVLQAAARYHVARDWDEMPGNGLHTAGDGLMYHLAVGRTGALYWCRDVEAVLWHCGAWPANAEALAVLVLIGGDQHATAAQLAALRRLCDTWRDLGHGDEVWGHQELQPTSCPGTLMADFVLPYREGRRIGVAYGHYFTETGHFVGGAFWEYWQRHGGLMIFGYPLTEEIVEDGRTVQYFERAVFEWWPENRPPYQVLLRRLGAAALAARETTPTS